LIYKNALIITSNSSFIGFIEIDDAGIVLSILPGNTDKEAVDCNGQIIMPGFIDSHTHGGYGMAFDDLGEKSFNEAYLNYLTNLVKEGVVAFAGTTVTSTLEKLEKSSLLINDLSKQNPKLPKLSA
jgi:N-acetylglucosamine-6-phosphate deacetylase